MKSIEGVLPGLLAKKSLAKWIVRRDGKLVKKDVSCSREFSGLFLAPQVGSATVRVKTGLIGLREKEVIF